jgi:TIR domain
MAAVPGYRHDVFVSYAHSDNVPVAGTEIGFVSQLVADLRAEVGRKIGKSLDIWWDHYNLSGNMPVTPEIMAAAGDCASIVVIASPAYLRSEWCDRERSTFSQFLGKRQSGASRAVFVVSIEPIGQEKLPVGLKDLTGYEFYRALEDGRTTRPLRTELDSDKEPYYNRLSQLVQNVTDHLDGLLTRASTPEPPAAVGPAVSAKDSAPCVLLLEVTDDLVQRRAELKDYLEQSGVVVLPDKRYPRDDIALCREQMLADLRRSRACVQILGPLAGDRSDDPRGLAWLRAETVRGAGASVPFLQWRDPDLALDQVTDKDARDLILPASVRTDRFPDFRRAVSELALKPIDRGLPRKPTDVLSVFVNSDLLDRGLGTGVAKWLEGQGFIVLEPPHATLDAREEWETNLRYCNSLVLVYGQTKPAWVKTQILLSNKIHRDTPLEVLGVCVGPPPGQPAHDKVDDLALRYAAIHYLRNEDSSEPKALEMEKFAAKLREVHGYAA